MFKKNLCSVSTFVVMVLGSCLASTQVNAGEMGPISSCSELSCMPFFLELGAGATFANEATVSVNHAYWNPSLQGYNSPLGGAALYMAGIGYSYSPLINFDINASYRGAYKYEKFQESTSTSEVINPLGTRTRYFNLSSNSLLFNLTLDGQGISDRLVSHINSHGIIQPFVGAGIGVSYNTISNFHTVLALNNEVTTVMLDNTQASLAYQFNAGIEWQYNRLSIDMGYRYFNGGDFKSNDYLVTRLNSLGTPITTITFPPLASSLSANEFFVTAKVAI